MVGAAAFHSTPVQRANQTHLVRGTINGSLAKDMILGPFVVAYAVQVQGFSNGQISWFLSLIPLLVLARYPFLDLLRRFPRITVLHWARTVQMSCLVALLVLPSDAITLPVLMLIGACFVIGNEFLQNAVWMNLVAEVSDHRDRGRFLGRLRTWKQATNMSFAALGFVIVGDHLTQTEFNILLLVVLVLLLNSKFWYSKIPPSMPSASVSGYSGKGQMLQILRRHPMLRRPLALTFVNAVLHWPILIVYVVGSLHLPANLLMLTVVASMLGSIVSEIFWGKKADARGIRQVFLLYFAGSVLLYPILLFVPDYAAIETGSAQYIFGTVLLLSFYFLRGVLDAGQAMAASMYRALYLNQAGGFHAVNVLTAINHLFTAILTAVGGIILVRLAAPDIAQWGLLWIDPFRLTTIALMLLTVAVGVWLSSGIRPQNTDINRAGDSV